MKTTTKVLGLAVLFGLALSSFSSTTFAGTGCVGGGTGCSTNTVVTVTITPGDICIGSDNTFNFGTYTVSASPRTATGSFIAPFFVDDLRGSNSGYYTTVQMSGNLVSASGGTISGSSVSMRTLATGSGAITVMSGTANSRVFVHTGMASFQTLDVARRLIQRDAGANSGVLGMYGVTPQMQLIIPAYQSIGIYQGTLVYTLYLN